MGRGQTKRETSSAEINGIGTKRRTLIDHTTMHQQLNRLHWETVALTEISSAEINGIGLQSAL